MSPMPLALVLAMLLFSLPTAPRQAVSILHIKVALVDGEQKSTPVPRHALLISDNPVSAPPRLVVTGLDGTVDVKLRPGRYTVESDRPVAFSGKAYQWTQSVEVRPDGDTTLELTAANADVEAVASSPTGAPAVDTEPSFLLPQWQDSIVALWTPTARASGFVVRADGLIVTSQRAIGTATSLEVQFTPATKVEGRVLAADPARDVALIRVDPKSVVSIKPIPLGCEQPSKAPIVSGQPIFTIGFPLHQPKRLASGEVIRVGSNVVISDFGLSRGSVGGPVFTANGGVMGMTTFGGEDSDGRLGDTPVVRAAEACTLIAAAEKEMTKTPPPPATPLPVEPVRSVPVDALRDAASRRGGSLNPYQLSTSTFDVAFITPVLIYGAQYQSEQISRRARGNATRPSEPEAPTVRPLLDFSNWSDYLRDFPPLLLVRVTPKLVEGFWTTVARGAARTQGIAVPPLKRIKSGFSRLRAFCGDVEVAPVHPFKLQHRVSDDDIFEGLYVFDPGALGPHCGPVKLTLYSEKEPQKGDTRVVDAGIVQQIWDDFASYRAIQP